MKTVLIDNLLQAQLSIARALNFGINLLDDRDATDLKAMQFTIAGILKRVETKSET